MTDKVKLSASNQPNAGSAVVAPASPIPDPEPTDPQMARSTQWTMDTFSFSARRETGFPLFHTSLFNLVEVSFLTDFKRLILALRFGRTKKIAFSCRRRPPPACRFARGSFVPFLSVSFRLPPIHCTSITALCKARDRSRPVGPVVHIGTPNNTYNLHLGPHEREHKRTQLEAERREIIYTKRN